MSGELQTDVQNSVNHVKESLETADWSQVVEDLKSDQTQRGVHDKSFEEALNRELQARGILPDLKIEGLDGQERLVLNDARTGQFYRINQVGDRTLDPDRAADTIHKACNEGILWGAGTDELTLIKIIGTASKAERDQIAESYEDKYGTSLEEELKDECEGKELAMILHLLRRTDEQSAADSIFGACRTFGGASESLASREFYQQAGMPFGDMLLMVLTGRTPQEDLVLKTLEGKTLQQLQTMDAYYKRRFGRSLQDDLRATMEGKELDTALELIEKAR